MKMIDALLRIRHPEDVSALKIWSNILDGRDGKDTYNDFEIQSLYSSFCEDTLCAGWIAISQVSEIREEQIAEFDEYLSRELGI